MAYKMKGAPMMANTKSHGTNANFKKSAMMEKPGAPGFLKNFARGKGALGLLNPLGAIGTRLGINPFGKDKPTGTPPTDMNTPPPSVAPATGVPPVNPNPAPAPTMDPNAVDPNAMPNAMPMAAGAPMYGKKKGAPMYGKKKGAPKLKGNQHKIDKNKDGKISKADFNMMNK